MKTWWEMTDDPSSVFVAYLCYQTSLPVFTTFKPAENETLSLFDWAGITVESSDDGTEYLRESGRVPYIMRLPYTAEMLERRKERLGQ